MLAEQFGYTLSKIYCQISKIFCPAQALDDAKKTVSGITGLELVDKTAKVDPSSGKITEYKVGVKIAFGVEH